MNGGIPPEIKAACATVIGGTERGTGYLIDDRHILTCEHVVRNGGPIRVLLGERGEQEFAGTLTKSDEASDCALLELSKPALGIEPLRIAATPSGWEWQAYGFPGIAGTIGLPLMGTIQDRAGQDVLRRPALVLYSEQAAAAQGPPMGGFSGSPVIVGGMVAGHLKRVLSSKDRPGRPELGLLFATPGSEILRFLGISVDAPVAVNTVEPPTAVPLGPDEFHVFISYSSLWRDWARILVEHLEDYKLRAFLDQNQLHPGDQLANAIQKGLARSRAAIVLLSRAWLESPWCQQEADVLLKRAVEDKSFRLIPLLLEKIPLPPLWDSRVYIDFSKRRRPEGPELDEVLYALLGGSLPVPESAEGKVREDRQRSIERMIERIDAEAITFQRVYQFWQRLHKTSVPDIRVTLHAANRLISLGSPRQALELLDTVASGIRARQLHALAMAKIGEIDDAIVELEGLEREGQMDPETGGILAGRYRQKGEQTGLAPWYGKARDTYRRYFEMTGDAYCGINAANLALHFNDRAAAVLIAGKLIDTLKQRSEDSLSYWDCATLGDAWFIIGDREKGRKWYEAAARKAAAFDLDRATMRRYARLALGRLGMPEDLVDDILQIPRPIAFFGHTVDDPDRPVPRFPPALVPVVRERIRQELAQLQVNWGASSACAGSDLLFLEEILARGGQATVVLPTDVAEFEVTYLSGNWLTRFRDVIAKKNNVKIKVAQPRDREDVWDACRREIVAITRELAKLLDQPRSLLVVWDGNSRNYVKSAIELWNEEGDPVNSIIIATAKTGGKTAGAPG